MTIPTPRIFPNPQDLPVEIIMIRLRLLDASVRLTAFQQGEAAPYTNHILLWSASLTNLQITNALAPALTAPEIADESQNITDLQQLDQWIGNIDTDIALINTSTTNSLALTGYKNAFSNATSYNALSNANRQELLRVTINAMLGFEVDLIKSVKILLKRAKRQGQ